MSDDIRFKTSWRTHPKRVKLQRRLRAEGVLAVNDLWLFCGQERTDGNLVGMTNEDIAIAAQWPADPDVFVNTLVEIGLLDGVPEAYQIHDWTEINPYVSDHKNRVEAGRINALKRWHKDGVHKKKPQDDCPLCHPQGPQKGAHGTPNAKQPVTTARSSDRSIDPPSPSGPEASASQEVPAAGLDELTELQVLEQIRWHKRLKTACSDDRRALLRTMCPVPRAELDQAVERALARDARTLGAVVDELNDMRKDREAEERVPDYHRTGPPEPLPPIAEPDAATLRLLEQTRERLAAEDAT